MKINISALRRLIKEEIAHMRNENITEAGPNLHQAAAMSKPTPIRKNKAKASRAAPGDSKLDGDNSSYDIEFNKQPENDADLEKNTQQSLETTNKNILKIHEKMLTRVATTVDNVEKVIRNLAINTLDEIKRIDERIDNLEPLTEDITKRLEEDAENFKQVWLAITNLGKSISDLSKTPPAAPNDNT